ncbi:FAD-binding domain-containing protein [Colletotrichum abscissum]|uniref:FAD-binding domain-containing protein n=1 Tax=Colletotrichum abscissum TaxID=1671311 RepID=A0A9P9XA89_9PEZI|nr:FAD-binding domain-containing protein [Colletotrichum abscissum]KAI3543674.1 FAD-binding domain-containing protein [Colletotrichum abscissum]KAK1495932.1 FAD-binding domain-containing protein [Colletotrichum abscissum]
MATPTNHPVTNPKEGVTYLTEDEITSFLDDLDHNGDGYIDYAEVEAKLDAAHDELAPGGQVKPHHVISRHASPEKPNQSSSSSDENRLRHEFLRSVMGLAGSDDDDDTSRTRRIPRAAFAARVREWKIPSLKQDADSETSQRDFIQHLRLSRRLRAYWAVHGPEIAFLGLVASSLIAFGVWQCVKYATTPQYRAAFGWGVVLAKTCAGMLYPTFFFLILSMSRYFSTLLRRSYRVSRFINWDLSQSFHIKISCLALALATLHAVGHLTGSFYHGSRPGNQDAVAAVLGPDAVPRPYVEYVRSLPGFTGITALGLFYLLALLSMPAVRRWNYEVFQLAHLLMYPIIGLMMAHGTAALLQWPMFGYFLAVPTLLILVERVVRVGTGFHRIRATLTVLDGETVEVAATIPSERMWKYRAGQYVFLQVPAISAFQWHPFTVSICQGREFRLHIKTDGNWTKRLRDLGGKGEGEADAATEIEVGINGPFGAPAQRFYDFNHTIIVGSGIGVTPFSGILADLQARDDEEHGGPTHSHHHRAHQHRHDSETTVVTEKKETNERKGSGSTMAAATTTEAPDGNDPTKPPNPSEAFTFAPDYRRVDFHWTVRDRNYLLWIADLLNSVSRSQDWHRRHEGPSQHLDIRIATHVTQKRRDIVTHVYRWLLEMHRTEEHPESPLTGLLNPTHFGRPDFDAILDRHYEDMRRFRASKRMKANAGGGAAADSMANAGEVGTDGNHRSENGDARADDRGSTRGASGERRDVEEEDEELKVGVFYCGAPVVGEILADKCRQLTVRGRHDGSKIEYHFMIEVFG